MKAIICQVNINTYSQNVMELDYETTETTFLASTALTKLPKVIGKLCADRNINTVCLGGNKAYIEEVFYQIKDSNEFTRNTTMKFEVIE